MRENFDTRHGKFDSPFTAFLYERVIMNGGDDEFASDGDGESVTRIGKHLVFEDNCGFVTRDTYENKIAAEVMFLNAADAIEGDEDD